MGVQSFSRRSFLKFEAAGALAAAGTALPLAGGQLAVPQRKGAFAEPTHIFFERLAGVNAVTLTDKAPAEDSVSIVTDAGYITEEIHEEITAILAERLKENGNLPG